MNFTDFLIFDAAAQAIYADPAGQRKCRACLTKLAETAERFPGRFLAEAARKDCRKGVAFKQKTLDDLEHSVFAQRLADRMPTKPAGGNYGDFLHQGILRQGEVLGDMQWGYWDIIRQALQLGGVNPEAITDPKTTPAQRHALGRQDQLAERHAPSTESQARSFLQGRRCLETSIRDRQAKSNQSRRGATGSRSPTHTNGNCWGFGGRWKFNSAVKAMSPAKSSLPVPRATLA